MLSARLITSSGDLITVSATEHPDLWWGLRGAGHNFGIVSELTMKAHPQINDGMHWLGSAIFPGPKLESVVETLNKMDIKPGMSATMIFVRPPPAFMVSLFHALSRYLPLTQEDND